MTFEIFTAVQMWIMFFWDQCQFHLHGKSVLYVDTNVPTKRWNPPTRLHGVTTQDTTFSSYY
jgi:hypothetical protein